MNQKRPKKVNMPNSLPKAANERKEKRRNKVLSTAELTSSITISVINQTKIQNLKKIWQLNRKLKSEMRSCIILKTCTELQKTMKTKKATKYKCFKSTQANPRRLMTLMASACSDLLNCSQIWIMQVIMKTMKNKKTSPWVFDRVKMKMKTEMEVCPKYRRMNKNRMNKMNKISK